MINIHSSWHCWTTWYQL